MEYYFCIMFTQSTENQMKFKYLAVLVFFVASAFGAARAQNVKGVVYGADTDEPLIGASVYWAGTTVGTGADAEGNYTIHRVKGYDMLVAGFVGYTSDTIRVESGVERVDFRLSNDGVELEEVVVNSTLGGNYVKRDGILKGEMISFAGLCKMACCNLAESFENSASVTVGYSDAISGARQIKMLGLAGTYTQILDENRPIMRGLSAPYGLSYTPGMWLNSIQVSKGISSVTAGHEAITGQINLEHRKPTDDERLFINFYLDDELRPELNLSTALPVTKDKKLSTILLLHGSLDTHLLGDMDDNGDGFMDLPKTRLGAVANRWLYTADNGAQVRWGFKYLAENRLSGQKHYKASMREEMDTDWDKGAMYGSQIKNRELNAYFKFGMPVGPGVYDEDQQDELRSNIAFVADYDRFRERAYFGLNDYDGTDNMVSLNMMYNHYFSFRHSLIVGVQSHLQFLDESLLNPTPWLDAAGAWNLDRQENEVGAYAEYTYTIKDKLSVVAGIRGDYNGYYDKFYVTPRGHIKWNITPTTILRGSAGLGYRSTNVITDNIGVLATGRHITFERPTALSAGAAAGQQRRHGGDRRAFPGRGSQHAHPALAGRLADVAPYALFVVAVYPAQQRKVLRRLLQQFRQLPVLRRAVEPLPEDRQFLFGGGSLEAGFEYFFDLVFETHVVFRVFRLVGVAGNNVSYGIDRKNERRTYNAGVFL